MVTFDYSVIFVNIICRICEYFLKHIFKSYVLVQCETAAQQEFAEELQKREHFLVEREQLLFRHETALSKIKGVEEEVLTRFQIMKEVTIAFDFREI